MIEITLLPPEDIARIMDIDRSEFIPATYTYENGQLLRHDNPHDCPTWSHDDDPHWSYAGHIAQFKRLLDAGGALIGAVDGERLAAFAVLRYKLVDDMAQLGALFVSNGYRRQGLAYKLCAEADRLAREHDAKRMYVSATPSESAVNFYLSQGFVPTDTPHPELFEKEPDDIHMVKRL
ncbi:MAG: GNAT family N-acetyltransferase [Anaerolineaceae bacterium]|nr:GNAT family N-acetyltransferase [Anaerolineaceae bacterium]